MKKDTTIYNLKERNTYLQDWQKEQEAELRREMNTVRGSILILFFYHILLVVEVCYILLVCNRKDTYSKKQTQSLL